MAGAGGVLRTCPGRGAARAEDVAVVGFDDEPTSRYLDPPLASVQLAIQLVERASLDWPAPG